MVNGKAKKVRIVTTPGGALPDGERILKQARKEVNYFSSSPQRADRLEKTRVTARLPKIGLKNFPATRVSYSVFMIQTILVNENLLNVHALIDPDFEKVLNNRQEGDLKFMQEMEAVLRTVFEYSQSEAQRSSKTKNSHLMWYRKWLRKTATYSKYQVLSLKKQPVSTRLSNCPREPRKVCLLNCFLKLNHYMSHQSLGL